MKYEIHIGEVIDLITGLSKPRQIFIITEEQFAIIEMFANQTKDFELNTIYKLNDCEFKLMPSIETGNSEEKLSNDLTQFTCWLVDSYELELNAHDVVAEYLSEEEIKTLF